MSLFGSPAPQWTEPRSAAGVLDQMYWHYDGILDIWSLTLSRVNESGALADSGGGVFHLYLTGGLPVGATKLRAARRAADTIFIY